jgi:hypothetical protein
MEAVHIIIIIITNENDGRRLLGTTLLKREKREDLSYLREETCLGGTKQYRSTHRHMDKKDGKRALQTPPLGFATVVV